MFRSIGRGSTTAIAAMGFLVSALTGCGELAPGEDGDNAADTGTGVL
jgi:hypothetical protein